MARRIKHWSQKFRDAVWLEEVKRRTGLSAPVDLDRKYIRDPDRVGAGLYQQFRLISTGERSPARSGRLGDLVALVDADSETAGTRELFESPFWTLLESPPPSVQAATNMVEELLNSMGMRRASQTEVLIMAASCPQYSRESLVVESVTAATRNEHPVKALALHTAMYREADLASCFSLLDLFIQAIDRILEKFLAEYFPVDIDTRFDIYHDVLDAIRSASRPRMEVGGNGWLHRESLSLPIVRRGPAEHLAQSAS